MSLCIRSTLLLQFCWWCNSVFCIMVCAMAPPPLLLQIPFLQGDVWEGRRRGAVSVQWSLITGQSERLAATSSHQTDVPEPPRDEWACLPVPCSPASKPPPPLPAAPRCLMKHGARDTCRAEALYRWLHPAVEAGSSGQWFNRQRLTWHGQRLTRGHMSGPVMWRGADWCQSSLILQCPMWGEEEVRSDYWAREVFF